MLNKTIKEICCFIFSYISFIPIQWLAGRLTVDWRWSCVFPPTSHTSYRRLQYNDLVLMIRTTSALRLTWLENSRGKENFNLLKNNWLRLYRCSENCVISSHFPSSSIRSRFRPLMIEKKYISYRNEPMCRAQQTMKTFSSMSTRRPLGFWCCSRNRHSRQSFDYQINSSQWRETLCPAVVCAVVVCRWSWTWTII